MNRAKITHIVMRTFIAFVVFVIVLLLLRALGAQAQCIGPLDCMNLP
jgi:hypothetical protein